MSHLLASHTPIPNHVEGDGTDDGAINENIKVDENPRVIHSGAMDHWGR
jgi:hypothetical protein